MVTRFMSKNAQNWVFLGFFLAFLYLILFFVFPWAEDKYYDLRYGQVRTYTIAFDLNPTDDDFLPTYFTAQNIEGRISVLAISPLPSNPTLELESPVLLGKNGKNEPILLKSGLINGDSYPDLVISVAGDELVYLAGNGTFTLSPDSQVPTSFSE